MSMRLPALHSLVGAVCLAGTLAAQQASSPPLFQLINANGPCEVRRAGADAFEPAVNRKAYPFGSTVRTGAGGKVMVLFSPASADAPTASVQLSEATEAVVDRDPAAVSNGIFRLQAGRVDIFAETDTAPKALTIETAGYAVSGFTGRAEVEILPAPPELQSTRVAVAKGRAIVAGDQFTFAEMRGGCAFVIETAADRGLTRITGEGGETVVTLENGTGEPLAFPARPRSIIKIWREFAPVGGRRIVAVFAVGPDGKRPECYAFAVGQPGMVSSESLAEETPGEAAEAAAPGTAAAAAPAAAADAPAAGMSAEDVDAAFKELFSE